MRLTVVFMPNSFKTGDLNILPISEKNGIALRHGTLTMPTVNYRETPFRLSISTTNTTLHSRALPVAGSQMTVLEASLYALIKNTIFRYLPVLRTLNPPTFIYNSWTQTIKLLHRLRSSDCPKLGKNTNSP